MKFSKNYHIFSWRCCFMKQHLSVGEGGRNALEFMKISQRIKNNIKFNLQRLRNNETELVINSFIKWILN